MTRPIFWIAAALSGGIAAARLIGDLPPVPFLLISLLLLVLAWRLKLRASFFWTALCGAVLALGPALVDEPRRSFGGLYGESLRGGSLHDGPVTLAGTIVSFPVAVSIPFEPPRLRSVMKAEWFLSDQGVWIPCDLRLQVRTGLMKRKLYRGDRLMASGTFLAPRGLRNPGGFDAQSYFKNQGVAGLLLIGAEQDCYWMDTAEFTGDRMESKSQSRFDGYLNVFDRQTQRAVRALQDFRDGVVGRIDRHLPYPENAVMKAVLLGDQWEIQPALRDAFAKSGTSHLLAISGGNIAVIAAILMGFFSIFRCPRRWNCAVTIGLLWIYCLLTAGAPSIVRATVMVSIVLFGIILKREPEPVTSLSWAAIAILIAAPNQLFDLGFQLSFITVLWMVTLLPEESPAPVNKRRRFAMLARYLRQNARLSLFAWLATLPHTSRIFYLATPIAVIANLFVVPYFGLVMASGLCFLFFGWFSPDLADILGLSAALFTRGFILMSEFFAAVPWGSFRVAPLSLGSVCAYYLFYGAWVLRRPLGIRPAVWWISALGFLNLWMWGPMPGRLIVHQPKKLSVTFLDVGHGDAAVVRFPCGRTMLVDAGDGARSDMGRRVVAPYLWSQGITKIDAVVVSHPHLDHYGGLPYLLKEFPIGVVWDNGDPRAEAYNGIFEEPRAQFLHGVRGRAARGPRREAVRDGDILLCDPDVRVWVRHPPHSVMEGIGAGAGLSEDFNPNNQSAVLQIVYGKFSVLLTGDAEEPAQARLAAKGRRIRSFVLKVPHHGSDEKESADALMAAVRPAIAVIPEAAKNKFNLPGAGTLRRLERNGVKIYQTGFCGAVEFVTDGETYELRTMTGN